MSDFDLLEELLKLASRLGIEIRWDVGGFKAGVLRLRGARLLYLNSADPAVRSVEVLCRVLQEEDLSHVFVLPAVRRRLEG